ncbi:MAG TPA: hypothetical protein PKX15_02150 [Bacteroidales bacterium]|nr:hypothetical protein [Bacteroidales bacterium]
MTDKITATKTALINAKELTFLLPSTIRKKYLKAIKDQSDNMVLELLHKWLPKEWGKIAGAFIVGKNDIAYKEASAGKWPPKTVVVIFNP